MSQERSETVKRVLIDMGIDASDIGPKSSFRKLGLDSLDMAQLLLDLETAFGIEIPDDDLQELLTVEDVAKYAEKRLA